MPSHIPFEVIAALRFLREGIVQTILIVIGVAVGVGVGVGVGVVVVVFMSALLDGVQANFLTRLLSTQGQVVILPQRDASRPVLAPQSARFIRLVQPRSQRRLTVDQWRKLSDMLRASPEVAVVSPMVSGSVSIIRGAAARTATFQGIEPGPYFRIVTIPSDIVAGTSRLTSQDLLIGKELAEELGVSIGEKVLVRAAGGSIKSFDVVGIFDLGSRIFNERTVIGTLNAAQGLLGLVGEVTSIDLALVDPYEADAVADTLAAADRVRADSWIRTNSEFFTAIRSQNVSSGTIRASVTLSVAFGMASVLVVSVVQRSREIGILRAMGASRGQMMRVFLVQGGLLGFAGSLFGSALARGLLGLWMLLARKPDGTQFFDLAISPRLYVVAGVLTTVCGVLAAVAPAMRAARLDPVDAIRA